MEIVLVDERHMVTLLVDLLCEIDAGEAATHNHNAFFIGIIGHFRLFWFRFSMPDSDAAAINCKDNAFNRKMKPSARFFAQILQKERVAVPQGLSYR